jgi:hypothetical protein
MRLDAACFKEWCMRFAVILFCLAVFPVSVVAQTAARASRRRSVAPARWAASSTYTYVHAEEQIGVEKQDVALTPRHNAGIVGMWERENYRRPANDVAIARPTGSRSRRAVDRGCMGTTRRAQCEWWHSAAVLSPRRSRTSTFENYGVDANYYRREFRF